MLSWFLVAHWLKFSQANRQPKMKLDGRSKSAWVRFDTVFYFEWKFAYSPMQLLILLCFQVIRYLQLLLFSNVTTTAQVLTILVNLSTRDATWPKWSACYRQNWALETCWTVNNCSRNYPVCFASKLRACLEALAIHSLVSRMKTDSSSKLL